MMDDVKEIAVKRGCVYGALDQQDLNPDLQPMGTGSRKSWLATFTQEHLPENRLRANEDDLSSKYESLACHRKQKKKKAKSRAAATSQFSYLAQKQRRRRGVIIDSSSEIRYETYIPLREMWRKYMEELLQFSNLTESSLPSAAQKIMKADFHGCPLTVQQSKCPSYIGVHGIVLQETRNVFVLVTPDSKVKQIPKANSIFSVVIHDVVFTIYGNQFLVKPGERAAKKFKSKPSIDL